MLFALLLSCSSAPPVSPADAPLAGAPSSLQAGEAATAAVPTTAVPTTAVLATAQPEAGWGAVLWQDQVWYQSGGGSIAVGAKTAVTLQPTGSTGVCGRVIDDPSGAMLVLPTDAALPTLGSAPAIQAALVERSAWRLDELLPAADRFSPAPVSPDPSRARGVTVGSVVKVRRHAAPPVLVASGHRDCTGIIAILDADAGRTLAYDRLDSACEPLRVLPPADLDGDGARELAAWSRSRAAVYRLVETSGSITLTRLADWRCP